MSGDNDSDDEVLRRANERLLRNRASVKPELPRQVLGSIADAPALKSLATRRNMEPNEELGDVPVRAKENPLPESLRSVSWSTLATLRNKQSEPSLGGVQTPSGVIHGHDAVRELRGRMRGKEKVVLLGESGAGKTISAAAWLAWAATSVDRPRWLDVSDFADETLFRKALVGDATVIDNLGYELHGAQPGSYLHTQWSRYADDFFDRWMRRRLGSMLLVTTWMDEEKMGGAYNGGMARRVYDGAEVIRIVRP